MSMSKNYDKIYNLALHFENVPIQKKTKNDSIIIKTTINISGWDIIFKEIENRKINIDLNNYESEKTINFSNTKYLLQEKFADLKITEVDPSFFVLKFEDLKTKKVAVKLDLKEDFPPNYYITKLKIQPDSVLITGDFESLNKTKFIKAEVYTVTEKDSSLMISLEKNETIKIEKATVKVNLKVEEFVEKEFIVPINIENNSEGVDLIIYPQEIGLKCLVPIKIYENIMASDFYISADFNNIEVRNDNRLILSIKSKPESVKNIQLEKEKVEYIIYQ